MNTLQDLSAQLEALHASALALCSLMEDLPPRAAPTEQRWLDGLHLARELADASDEARAHLVRCSNAGLAYTAAPWLPARHPPHVPAAAAVPRPRSAR
ncbi:MAG: hypothetical protein GTN84_10020 [Hydrogenophaga sp.]|uniref:hypothetical protein n=1 Tax=Hydrogenophaga sp. TaxID=1904254 RepID=UPI0016A98AA3|nr:hypothetical protein [Hydrogenophaga sp.]NIM41424.1 hypothetical protein [Hydrogenophaga sp.]NIN26740.1 hypothetical protein [Hydrogenophaga sp.]NIN30062.1 hypothetical protein [Hydrogenophaga sp.]NIN55670.1 hypothetical protein [Hydrogenophaga sp.]NIO52667.1 hypothetical protein [Hydrogenophaga sp.]